MRRIENNKAHKTRQQQELTDSYSLVFATAAENNNKVK